MRLIIAGSRRLQITIGDIDNALLRVGQPTAVLSGMARGPDLVGALWAVRRGLRVERYPALWAEHGTSAGPIRNALMARKGDALLAFYDGVSAGTKDMIRRADERGLSVHIVHCWKV